MMRIVTAALAALLLAGCAGGARVRDMAEFDLGAPPVRAPADTGLRGLAVEAPSWLATPALQYRLVYADPARRLSYVESRWAAPPAELVQRRLERALLGGPGGCRMRLQIEELVQVFDAPQSSRVVLEARAMLFAGGGAPMLARRAFAVQRPAPTPDARGGVAATGAAVDALAGELAGWLAAESRGGNCR